jgi:LPPG:FO 2-phospho-L-lactate transferase
VLALAGGVGGAKLAAGLAHLLADRLTVLVNTADDFDHLGLHVSPDVDTVVYTLAGLADRTQGWGRAEESWTFMAEVERLGGPTWFRLGDRDLAMNAIRTARLRAGDALSAITREVCTRLGLRADVVPMTDDRVRTVVRSGGLSLAFQDYFVRFRCEPKVDALVFEGAETARYARAVDALTGGAPVSVIVCPSNPYLSIDPILSLPGLRTAIRALGGPVIAVSPIVAGSAIKGPAAKIMLELGREPSAIAVASHYAGLIDGFVLDERDRASAHEIEARGIAVRVAPSIMTTDEERVALARVCLDFADDLRRRGR